MAPGSHRTPLPHRRVGSHVAWDGEPESPQLIEAEAGDVVLFSSFLLHRTQPNVSNERRWAYVIEYMSTAHFDPYVDSPYLMVARHGRPHLEYRRFYRGRLDPRNQLKYLVPRLAPALRSKLHAGARRLVPDRWVPYLKSRLRPGDSGG